MQLAACWEAVCVAPIPILIHLFPSFSSLCHSPFNQSQVQLVGELQAVKQCAELQRSLEQAQAKLESCECEALRQLNEELRSTNWDLVCQLEASRK